MSKKKTIGTIRFELRKGVRGENGKLPVSLIYSIKGNRKRFSLDQTILSEYWDAKEQRAFYIPQREAKRKLNHLPVNQLLTEIEINEINDILDSVEIDIKAIEDKFLALSIPFSSQTVIDALISKKPDAFKVEEKTDLVFDYIDRYIVEHEASREAGSLSVYKSIKNHLKAYQDATNHKVTFEGIDYSFFNKFQNFLIKRTKTDKAGNINPMLNNTTIAKALSTLKTFLTYAKKEGVKVNDSFRDFTIKREKLEVIALEQNELQNLIDFDLSNNKRLDKVRDIFVFACATGLRFSDVQQLKAEHLDNESINIVVKKTKTALTVPLNIFSAGILEKYSELNKPLPTISNQKLNEYIKELCELAGIAKQIEIVRFFGKKRIVTTYPKFELISFHTARKTFVTLSLERGMSAEEVMTISGHEDYKSFKRYVNITEKRKKVVMLKAWGAPKERKLKVV
ncbi:integrase [Pedobacter sp. UYP30]|uniref:site-specific integrase n=1 Tax=Pedobacter sp. UYP30 TaxID=1756400 RepID=UPI00339805B2